MPAGHAFCLLSFVFWRAQKAPGVMGSIWPALARHTGLGATATDGVMFIAYDEAHGLEGPGFCAVWRPCSWMRLPVSSNPPNFCSNGVQPDLSRLARRPRSSTTRRWKSVWCG